MVWAAIVVGAVVVLSAVAIYATISFSTGGSSPPGKTAPDFTLVDSTGRTFSLGDFRGKPVVLFFMTSGDWCLPCKIETRDHLVPLQETFGSRIQIVSLEMIPENYGDADLNAYRAQYGSDWIYARDTTGVARAYGVRTLSTIVIVDSQGTVAFFRTDPPFETMAQVLRDLGA